jgi:hypothetical protein
MTTTPVIKSTQKVCKKESIKIGSEITIEKGTLSCELTKNEIGIFTITLENKKLPTQCFYSLACNDKNIDITHYILSKDIGIFMLGMKNDAISDKNIMIDYLVYF